MQNRKPLILAAAAAVLTPVCLMLPARPSVRAAAPFYRKNIAHRGLHTPDKKIPENSMPAFRAAAEADYGIELDVQLSKDGEVVVFHDNTLDRVCGVHARVDELNLAELRALRLCGSEETIPLFSEVLEAVNGRSPIVCELKTGKRNKELCKKTLALIKAYPGDVCIESFDPFIVAWFRVHAPGLMRGQLASLARTFPKTQPLALRFALSRCMLNILARPHFIAYDVSVRRPLPVLLQRLCGAMLIGWTSHGPENEGKNDAVIFEFYRPQTRY